MAKKDHPVSFNGVLEVETMEILEEDKNGQYVYDLLEELKQFDGKKVSIKIKEELSVEPKE
jgi:hypothetical protein